jgi:hypothetical protein
MNRRENFSELKQVPLEDIHCSLKISNTSIVKEVAEKMKK